MRTERLKEMEDFILRKGSASLEDITQEFQISVNTARRDIAELLRINRNIKKVYGGVNVEAGTSIVPCSSRINVNASVKDAIGKLAARLVSDGDAIYLDSGSTTPHIIKYLKDLKNVTVLTNNLMAMTEASLYSNINLISLGGLYNQHTASFVGSIPLEALNRFRIRTVFLSATGVSLQSGLTNSTYMEAEMKRFVASKGERRVLLADHSKFGKSAAVTFYDFHNLYSLVTDICPAEPYLSVMEQYGMKLLYQKDSND